LSYGDFLTWLEPFKAQYLSYLNLQDQITQAIERRDEAHTLELEQAGNTILEQVATLKFPLPTSVEFRKLSVDMIRELHNLIRQAQHTHEKNSESLRGWIKESRPSLVEPVPSPESTYSSLSRLGEQTRVSLPDAPGDLNSPLSPFSRGQEKIEALGEQVNHQS